VGVTAAEAVHGVSSSGAGIARRILGVALGPVAAVALWFAPISPDPLIAHALAITVFMVAYWIFEPIDHGVTGLIGCYLFWALGVAKFETAFSGFADSTPWFLFGAVLMGEAASKSGLAVRIGRIGMGVAGASYGGLLLSVIVLVLLLNFLVPSGMAQLAILAPMVMGIVKAFGVEKGSRIGRGLFVILTYSCGLFNKMILAGGATVLARGLVERITGQAIPWSTYFIAYLPAIVVTVAASWLTVMWLYPPERRRITADANVQQNAARLAWSTAEKKTAMVLGLAIVLWATDFAHHIDPAVIALGAGLAVALPGVGVLTTKDIRGVNFLLTVFLGAALSMGTVLIQTKALNLVTGATVSWMAPYLGGTLLGPSVLYWAGFLYHFLLGSELSMLSTSLPVMIGYANQHGLNPEAVAMVLAFASGGKLFVYQSSVLVQGLSYGYFDSRDMLKIGLVLSIVEGLVLLVLAPLYWPLVGVSWTAR
jgi:sodium-dependent dicarboxylate transporter 2/3/5